MQAYDRGDFGLLSPEGVTKIANPAAEAPWAYFIFVDRSCDPTASRIVLRKPQDFDSGGSSAGNSNWNWNWNFKLNLKL
jgi:hypothetical protein